jgi:RimJ/RimL family protein N-acetyltransferase
LIPVFGKDQLVAEFVSAGIGDHFSPPYVCIGFSKDAKTLCGGAIFNNWNGANIEISIYGPGALTRGAIRVACRYAFGQSNATRMTAKTRRSNKRMQALLPRLGFTFEGVQKRFFGPDRADDALLYALFPQDAEKWMK